MANTNANKKTTPATTKNSSFVEESRATYSMKQHSQPLITAKRNNLSPTQNTINSKTIAPVFLGGKPPYPWLSRRNHEEGKVLLRIQVNLQGRAILIQIKRSSGSARLDNAAINHVQNNIFTPAQHNGKPIIAWKELRFVFQLN